MNLEFNLLSKEEFDIKLPEIVTNPMIPGLKIPKISLAIHELMLQEVFETLRTIEIKGEKEFWTKCGACSGTGKWSAWGCWTYCPICSGRGKWSDTVSFKIIMKDFHVELQPEKIILELTISAQSSGISITDRQEFEMYDLYIAPANGNVYASLFLETFRLPNCPPWLESEIQEKINEQFVDEPMKIGEIPRSINITGIDKYTLNLQCGTIDVTEKEIALHCIFRSHLVSPTHASLPNLIIKVASFGQKQIQPIPLKFSNNDMILNIDQPISTDHFEIIKNHILEGHHSNFSLKFPNIRPEQIIEKFSKSIKLEICSPYQLLGANANEVVKNYLQNLIPDNVDIQPMINFYAKKLQKAAKNKLSEITAVVPFGLRLNPHKANFASWRVPGTPKKGEVYRVSINPVIENKKVSWVINQAEKL